MQYVIRDPGAPISRDMVIEDERGHATFRVHRPVVGLRDELRLDDADGAEQAWIKDPILSDGSKYEIHRGGKRYADVNRIVESDRLGGFDIRLATGESLAARGDMVGRYFTIMSQDQSAALVRRQRGKIEVKTEQEQDDVLLLAGVLAICAMIDSWERKHSRNA